MYDIMCMANNSLRQADVSEDSVDPARCHDGFADATLCRQDGAKIIISLVFRVVLYYHHV